QPLVPAVQVTAVVVADVRLQRSDLVAELLGVGDGGCGVPGGAGRPLALRRERGGQQVAVQLHPLLAGLDAGQVDVGQVDQPRAGQLRVEHRGLDVRGRTQTDVQAVGARGEGQVDVDADQVA